MPSHMSTSATETVVNAPAFIQQSLSEDDCNSNNEQFSKLLSDYSENTHTTINFQPALHRYLNSLNNYQRGEGIAFQFFHDLARVYKQQQKMLETLNYFQNHLAHNFRYVNTWTKVLVLFFTAAGVIIAAAAAATATKPAAMAAAAAAPILLAMIGSWTLSRLCKYKDTVKKHYGVTGVMLYGVNMTIDRLNNLHSSARRFEFHAKSVVEMEESGHGEVKKKLEAVKKSFEELQGHAADFCRDIHIARLLTEVTVESVVKHLD